MTPRDRTPRIVFKLLIVSIILLIIPFIWKEWDSWSFAKKINSEKISAFFTAIGALLTAATVFLIYRQIQEQIEDRKAASRPDLYPEKQFFTVSREIALPKMTRDGKTDIVNGLINLHNIGLAAAKEITVKWHFQKDVLSPMVKSELLPLYTNRDTEFKYAFIPQGSLIEVPLPIMYVASLAFYKQGWTEMIWEELFLELTYKDIHSHECPIKRFRVTVYVGLHYALFIFDLVNTIHLKAESTMISRELVQNR